MPVSAELIQSVARELHRRSELPESLAEELAARLEGLVTRLRAVDESQLRTLGPALTFDVAHDAYRQPIDDEAPIWRSMEEPNGGSGYGGTKGTTGVEAPTWVPRPRRLESPEWVWWDAVTLAGALRRGDLQPVHFITAVRERISATEPAFNAFVTVMDDAAMQAARVLEQKSAEGEALGPLAGVPVALKDLYDTAGVLTTAGSQVYADRVPERDATAVRLLREAGAISVGKTATHEFAFGPTTDSPYLGPTRNPWNTEHSPAGSSGGSAAAVAAGIVPLAMGTDTGGSIRMPAAACGIVGLKPTYGRVSKHGVIPLSWSLDHAGPLTRSVADAALALSVLAGPDPLDPTAAHAPVDDYTAAVERADDGLASVRIGVPTNWLDGRLDADVRAAFERAVETLRDLGATVDETTLPPVDVMILVNRIITMCEAGAYHADLLARHGRRYAPDVRARLELGQFVPTRDYLTAQRLRGELSRAVAGVMAEFDALVTPTLPIPAPRIGQNFWRYGDGTTETVAEAMIRYTAPISVSGNPALSVPCGFTEAGLPVGLQIVGRLFDEATVLRIGAAFEASTAFHKQRPVIT